MPHPDHWRPSDCWVCRSGWGSSPVNFGKSGYGRQTLCEEHRGELREAERRYRQDRRRGAGRE
jgi:hypothetical protein